MEVFNKELYYNSIYQAIVVNEDSSMDPANEGRVQIYIPDVHYRYAGIYKTYMNDTNKRNNEDKNKFPWAVPLTESPKNGNVVFCGNINNRVGNYVIFGLDANNPANQGVGGTNSTGGLLGADILSLAMPIIIQNEVGINASDYPDNIPQKKFIVINPYDNGGWSIGLIQWHHARAYDILYYIASNDSNWESYWTDKSLDLYNDLKKSISKNNASQERNKYGSGFHPTLGTPLYSAIQGMLGSKKGQQCQIEYSQEDTRTALNMLQNDPYNLTNPALIIYILDIMNQYGNGVNNVITGCITEAASINKNNKNMMDQLNDFVSYWKGRTTLYYSRRDTTYAYISQLDKEGKLFSGTLVDLGDLQDTQYIPESGEYLWPLVKSTQINCYWGINTMPVSYNFKYNKVMGNVMGYPSGGWHSGVDFGPAKAGVDGDPVIAVGSGTVAYVCAEGTGGQGNCIGIRMNKNPDHYFVYMHLCKKPTFNVGDKVTAGQVIGYMGTTGNSTGTHLHLGLHIGAVWPTGGANNRNVRIDCLPYLGKKANA